MVHMVVIEVALAVGLNGIVNFLGPTKTLSRKPNSSNSGE